MFEQNNFNFNFNNDRFLPKIICFTNYVVQKLKTKLKCIGKKLHTRNMVFKKMNIT